MGQMVIKPFQFAQQAEIGKTYTRSAASLLAGPVGILTLAVGPRAGAIHGSIPHNEWSSNRPLVRVCASRVGTRGLFPTGPHGEVQDFVAFAVQDAVSLQLREHGLGAARMLEHRRDRRDLIADGLKPALASAPRQKKLQCLDMLPRRVCVG